MTTTTTRMIRIPLSASELDMIDRHRGGLRAAEWAAGVLHHDRRSETASVPAYPAGPTSKRLAVRVEERVAERAERSGLALASWGRDAVLRRLWELGERW